MLRRASGAEGWAWSRAGRGGEKEEAAEGPGGALGSEEQQSWGGCLGGKDRTGASWRRPGDGGCLEMQSQCLPHGVTCPHAVTVAPPSLAHQWETRASSWPHMPPGTSVPFMHKHPEASTGLSLFAGASLVLPRPLLKPLSAVCRCLALQEPRAWRGPPQGSQSRWDAGLPALAALLSRVAAKALAPTRSAHRPRSAWGSISCTLCGATWTLPARARFPWAAS